MKKQLKCFLLLPLKEIALRRVVNLFWNDSDILSFVSKFNFEFNLNEGRQLKNWQECTENIIEGKIRKLLLPESLIKELIALIKHVSSEVIEWKDTHQSFLDSRGFKFGVPGRAKLYWTTIGTINYRETAEELIPCNEMDVEARYVIACYYCLEDYIPLYWMELSEEKKMKYGNCKAESPDLPYCWPHILQGKYSELDYLWITSTRNFTSFNQCAFEFYVRACCTTTAQYFLQKLTQEERETSLMRSADALTSLDRNLEHSYLPELIPYVLFFLVSEMTHKQQMKAIRRRREYILTCFVRWPWLDLFFENGDFFWGQIDYTFLIDDIFYGYKDSEINFPKTFKKLLIQSPPYFKKHFVQKEYEIGVTAAHEFLKVFLANHDSVCIRALFRTLDNASRVNIIFQDSVVKLFYENVVAGKCDLVILCLREATLSKNEKVRLTEALAKCIEDHSTEKSRKSQFKTILNFLDETNVCSLELNATRKRKLEVCSPE